MATLISDGWRSEASSWYDVTTEKGVTFGVCLSDYGAAHIYLQHNSPRRLCLGKRFSSDSPLAALEQAREYYKTSAMKAALSALLAHIADVQVPA